MTPQVAQTILWAGQWIQTNAYAKVTMRVINHFDMSFPDFWNDLNETEQNDLAGPRNITK